MKPDCPSWSLGGIIGGGVCAENRYGGKPSYGTCANACKEHDGEWRVQLRTEIGKEMDRLSAIVAKDVALLAQYRKDGLIY